MKARGKVLLVDDDADFVAMNSAVLEDGGYDVVVAYNARDGLAKARAEPPDLVIMDLLMTNRPEGVTAIYDLRADKETKDIPILVITALFRSYPCFHEPDDLWELVDAVLRKPVAPHQLLSWVNKLLMEKSSSLKDR